MPDKSEWFGKSNNALGRLLLSEPARKPLLVLVGCSLLPAAAIAVLFPIFGIGAALAVAVLLGLVGGTVLAVLYLRRSALLLSELAARAHRIGAGDFELPAMSDDLIQGPAGTAFDEMTAQLEGRFYTLERAAELEREILSSVDTPGIAQTVLDLVPSLYPCRGISLTVLDPHSDSTATTWMDRFGGGGSPTRTMAPVEMSPAELQRAMQQSEWFELGEDSPAPGYLAHLRSPGGGEEAAGAVAFPLQQAGELVGVLAVRDNPATRTGEALRRLRQVADRIAVALSNARAMDQVRMLAFYDSLTRLPNRVLYRERLGQAIGRARPAAAGVAVCSLDLDHFGRINETLGPALGDRLIQEVGVRLGEVCQPLDPGASGAGGEMAVPGWTEARGPQVARLGGDEFAVILPELSGGDREVVTRFARRLLGALQHPFKLGAQEVFITASIGIAVHPEDGGDSETLHQNAEVALSHAKKEGRNTIERYSASMNAQALGRMRLEHELRKAVENGEFTLWYQPVVDLRSRWATGAEALVRWDHPERGLIPPGEFIQLCEESGVIVPLGEWSLWSVCSQARRWVDAGFTGLQLSVNLSARQLRQRGIVRTVQDILEETGARPEHLAIELTESLLMEPGGTAERRLRELAELGVSLAIDDFGTGYSSLSYLKNFPVSTLKIDRSFIVDVTTDANAAAITTAVLALGKALELQVVAEGVETKEQANFLKWKGCQKGQGYLLGRPAPVEMFTQYLGARQRRRASA